MLCILYGEQLELVALSSQNSGGKMTKNAVWTDDGPVPLWHILVGPVLIAAVTTTTALVMGFAGHSVRFGLMVFAISAALQLATGTLRYFVLHLDDPMPRTVGRWNGGTIGYSILWSLIAILPAAAVVAK
jgi:hypothetical protein